MNVNVNVSIDDMEVDKIVKSALDEAIRLNLEEDYDEGGHPLPIDRKLVDAMILVRGYFSPVNEKTCPGCSGCNADYDGDIW